MEHEEFIAKSTALLETINKASAELKNLSSYYLMCSDIKTGEEVKAGTDKIHKVYHIFIDDEGYRQYRLDLGRNTFTLKREELTKIQ